MDKPNLTDPALQLAEATIGKLERWLALFEIRLAEAEERGAPADLKELVAFLTALKRTLEIARIAEVLAPHHADDEQAAELDPESLRRLFSEED